MSLRIRPTSAERDDHIVQFYAQDDELIAGVGPFLAQAVLADGVAIVVCTDPHRPAIEARLRVAGVDVVRALARGSLIVVDAETIIDRIMLKGRPDPDRFEAVIGSLVLEAGRDGGIVHVFGEMVDLLWERGLVNAALEVENMVIDMSGRVAFACYCGYRLGTASNEHPRFRELCGLHSAVLGPSPDPSAHRLPVQLQVSRGFPCVSGSPAATRRFVAAALQGWGLDRLAASVVLIGSELATNAIIHARSEFTVTLARIGNQLRISVSDDSPTPAVRQAPSQATSSGRGLELVASLSRRWGSDPHPGGKVVWAEVN